jgi:hypothetical protein
LPVEVWSQFMRTAHRGKPLPPPYPPPLAGEGREGVAAIPPPITSVPLPPAGIPGGRASPMRPADGVPAPYPPPLPLPNPPPPAGQGRAGAIDRLFLRR